MCGYRSYNRRLKEKKKRINKKLQNLRNREQEALIPINKIKTPKRTTHKFDFRIKTSSKSILLSTNNVFSKKSHQNFLQLSKIEVKNKSFIKSKTTEVKT